jgi:hypothetical protein
MNTTIQFKYEEWKSSDIGIGCNILIKISDYK